MRLLTIGAMQQQSNIASIDVDLRIYLASLTTPLSAPQIALLNTFVTDLKAGLGITRLYDFFDDLLIIANETSEAALKNLAKRAHDAIAVNAPIFTALEGFTGTLTGQRYIDTNYNAVTQGVNYTLNDAATGIYQRLLRDSVSRFMFGAVQTNGYVALSEAGTGARMNNISADNLSAFYGLGMNILSRPEAANYNFHGNKNTAANIVRASTGVPNCKEYLLTYSNNDAIPIASQFSDTQLSFYFKSKAVTQANVNVIYDTFQAYMTANGKQV